MAEDKNIKQQYLNFDEYIRQGEPEKKERAEAWRVAIGLQAVDGLKTSEYLQETARRNIEGEMVCLSTLDVSATMIFLKKSGCCETILCSMDAGKTSV